MADEAPVATGATAEGGAPEGTPSTPANPAAPASNEPELFEVTIDGQKTRWTRERLIAEAQKSGASQKRFEEAARKEKELQGFLSNFKNPEQLDTFVKRLGYEDPAEFFREGFARHLQAKIMPEEQRKLLEKEQENKRLREQLEERDRKASEERKEALRQEIGAQYDADLAKEFKAVGIPMNAFTIKRASELGLEFLDRKQEPNWKVIAQIVDEEFMGGFSNTLASIDDDAALTKRLPESVMKRIRKADLQRLRNGTLPTRPAPTERPQPKTEEQPKKKPYMDRDDLQEYLEKVKREAGGK